MTIRVTARAKSNELHLLQNTKHGDDFVIHLYPYQKDKDLVKVELHGKVNQSEDDGDLSAVRLIDAEIRDITREHLLCYTAKDVIDVLERVKQQIKK